MRISGEERVGFSGTIPLPPLEARRTLSRIGGWRGKSQSLRIELPRATGPVVFEGLVGQTRQGILRTGEGLVPPPFRTEFGEEPLGHGVLLLRRE